MKLVIVESPTKAKTISHYLDSSYEVRPSVGHVRDLPKSNKKAIDIAAGFVPHYEIAKGKSEILAEIKALAVKADEVILATDPDREGEAIAWHIKEACGLKNPKRIVFHEITKDAILEAISHPRQIDENLRRAQEARRVLDRLVGYDLSGLIWKKVRYGLSAGRVQSPALRILMEREREIRAFIPEIFWVISVSFTSGKKNQEAFTLICEEEPREHGEVKRIIEATQKHTWKILAVKQTEAKRVPRAPFTTSTLQQSASSRLGFSPSRTMGIAQKLYEQGLITYMRTDSVNLGQQSLADIAATVQKKFGAEYYQSHIYITKSKNAQEAHEAVRPTSAVRTKAGKNEEQQRLYQLIWSRAVSSQMADAKILRTKVSANIDGPEKIPDFSITGSVVLFDGWLAADPGARGEDIELPHVSANDPLTLQNISEEQKATEPPGRYTEAGLVKELERREIGRPSTYASIIKTLADRGYVDKLGKTLMPTDTGDVVSSFLEANFANYISDSFTAEMEDTLDKIASGEREYEATLKKFYTPFSKDVKSKEKMEKVTNLGDADPAHTCPVCQGPMIIKLGRTGKFLSCKRFPECVGARKIDGSIMEPPKETGEPCPECKDGKLMEREGRFGKFIACSNFPKCKFVKQSEEQAEKMKTGVKCPACKEGDIVERRGRFGPFFSCSNYPKCKFIVKSRPTGKTCDHVCADGSVCGALMMEGTKTIPERCSDRTCPNHNPHKKDAITVHGKVKGKKVAKKGK